MDLPRSQIQPGHPPPQNDLAAWASWRVDIRSVGNTIFVDANSTYHNPEIEKYSDTKMEYRVEKDGVCVAEEKGGSLAFNGPFSLSEYSLRKIPHPGVSADVFKDENQNPEYRRKIADFGLHGAALVRDALGELLKTPEVTAFREAVGNYAPAAKLGQDAETLMNQIQQAKPCARSK